MILNSIRRIVDYVEYFIKKKYPLVFVFVTGGYLECGPNTAMRKGGTIRTSKIGTVSIGDWCSIGKNVTIAGVTHNSVRATGLNRKIKEAPINIGNNVWIGNNVFIAPGVSIGDCSIIGANAVVRKDVPTKGYVRVVCDTLVR